VAAALFVVAGAIAFVLGQNASDKLDTTIEPLGETLVVEEQGRSIFVDAEAGEDVSCRAKPADSPAVELSTPDSPLQVEVGGRQWTRVGTTSDMVTGEYDLSCVNGEGDAVAAEDIGITTDPNFGGAAILVGLAFLIAVGAAIIGVSLAGIVFWRRRRAAQPNED
jgi:hypothetical protein